MIRRILGKGEATQYVKKKGERLVSERAKEMLWRINSWMIRYYNLHV